MTRDWLYDYHARKPLRLATPSEMEQGRAAETDSNPLGRFDSPDGLVYLGTTPDDSPGDETWF